MKVFSPHHIEGLLKYKYKGTDYSLISKYLLGPWAEFWVSLTPVWIAPNLITIAGWFFCVSSFLLVLLLNPNLDSSGPAWINLYTAICMFIYQTLDAMDGKQVIQF